MTRNLLRFAAALGLLTSAVSSAFAGVVFQDTFNYADTAALVAAGWTDGGPGAPAFDNSYYLTGAGSNFISTDPAHQPTPLTNQTLTRLNNAVIFKDLGVTLTEGWTLTANVAIAGYSRAMQIGLGDAATGAGYSLQWNAGGPTQHAGHGFFALVAQDDWTVSNPTEINNPGSINLVGSASLTTKAAFPTGYALPNPVFFGEGDPPVNKVNYTPQDAFLGYTEIKLIWSPETNILEAHVNNDQIPDEETLVTSFDYTGFPLTPYTSFSHLYISGGTNSFVDFIKVESDQIVDPPSEPGDFDGDGDVDGRDFLIWQRGETDSPLSPAELLDWQEHYGTGTLVATSIVPEPGSLVLFTVIGGALAAIRRR